MKTNRNRFSVLILAAGQGTRMRGALPKVLHPLCGRPLLIRVLSTVTSLEPFSTGVVVGQGAEEVMRRVGGPVGVEFIRQKAQKGSGNAVQCAAPWIRKNLSSAGQLMVLCADTPLISAQTLSALRDFHARNRHAATILSASFADPTGYGRIVKDSEGRVKKIVEEKDAAPGEREIREVNSGIYCFQADRLLEVLPKLRNDNAKKEYYLTDVIQELYRLKAPVGSFHRYGSQENALETMGVNSRADLAAAEEVLQRKLLKHWMERGVTVLSPGTTYIGEDVEIGEDSRIFPGTMIRGKTRIGAGCEIGPHALIEDCEIGQGATIRASFLYGTQVGDRVQIGPYAHLRPGTRVLAGARVGNFSEVKNSEIGPGAKVSHLSYVGDSSVGADVNVGAGVITCNFDGKEKHRTVIGARSFIGSNVNLVAPVKVGSECVVGAGSTITEDVPDFSLALERSQQVIKQGWTKKRR